MAKRPDSIRRLQRKLYLRSKQSPDSKFYSLYDKIYRKDILLAAYAQCRANKGSPGIDGLSFEELESTPNGVEVLLSGIQKDLQLGAYRPNKIKRVLIPKDNGKVRPLGIASIRDRVVQMALTLVMQPVYEPHLHDGSYGYRPKRKAQDAIKEIEGHLKQGYTQVLDADLSSYFDCIPHEKLLEKVARRISDHNLLSLLRKIIKAPVAEVNEQGKTKVKPSKVGTPQGAAVSPLLSLIYLNDFCLDIHNKTPCKIVSFADDFVIMHKEPFSKVQLDWFEMKLESEGLTLNSEKTQCVDMSITGAEFNFLGFRLKKVRGFYRKTNYIKIEPSSKSQAKFKATIRDIVKHRTSLQMPALIGRVNRVVRGWKNYFGVIGHPRKIFFLLDWFVVKRFYLWARSRSQRRSKYLAQDAWEKLYKAGLIYLQPVKRRTL